MDLLPPHSVMTMLLSLGILIGTARLMGEAAQRLHQPSVLGELLAGVLLGPTVLGSMAPELCSFLFPSTGTGALVLDAIANLSIVFFLMVAGIEVNLSTLWKQGKTGAKIGLTSIFIPFLFGIVAAWLVSRGLGRQPKADPLIFALFLAIAISISALPIIVKTLMDLDLYRSDLGMSVISAAIFNDLIGWMGFAVVTGLLGGSGGKGTHIFTTIGLTLVFAGGILTIGRRIFHRLLPFVQAYTRWPGGELTFAMVLSLLGAAFTEWIGIHAIFGAFFVGAALGDSPHLREHTRITIDHFVSYIFAPVFFAGIGLKVNFCAHFDLPLVATVFFIAAGCKIVGGTLGARWGGLPKREAWAVGFAMASVGAMGIIVGLTALRANIIYPRLFVALVIMAIATAMISGPAIRLILKPPKKWRLREAFSAKGYIGRLQADSRREVIHEMSIAAAKATGLDIAEIEKAVWTREKVLSTGIGNAVAIPHARIEKIVKPAVVVGISSAGIDFDAPDGRPAEVIFLILTPSDNPGTQLLIGSELAKRFRHHGVLERARKSRHLTDFLALLQTTDDGDYTHDEHY